jgi:colicin import membrane protein
MTRITTLLLLVMFWSVAAFAAVYQCRDQDGNLFLTNNRNKFPPGCVQVGEPIGEVPAPSPPAATAPVAPGSESKINSASPPPSQAPPAPREETKPEAPSPEAGAPAGEAEMTPAAAPETGPRGASPGQSGEQPPQQDDQAAERTDEAPGQPDQPNVATPVEGGEMPAGEEAGATKEGELE